MKNIFINKANKLYNNKYGYDKVTYKNNKTKVIIECPIHGEFTKTPWKHISGQGCPKCTLDRISKKLRTPKEELIIKFNKVHNNNYIKMVMIN
jgi:hypothetical protein